MIFNKYSVVVFLLVALVAPAASAQETNLPNPGITPDSPFYFLDKWGESFGRLFAFGNKANAAKQSKYAEERLAEAKQMAEEGKQKEVQEAINGYGNLISDAAAELSEAAKDGKNIEDELTNLVTKATLTHQTVLAEVYQKVPEQAQPGIQQAMTKSLKGQNAALNSLSEEHQERIMNRVMEQNKEVERQVERMRERGMPIPSTVINSLEKEQGVNLPTAAPGRGQKTVPDSDFSPEQQGKFRELPDNSPVTDQNAVPNNGPESDELPAGLKMQ